MRSALALFIATLAGLMDEAFWFSVRGDCKMSLCLTTMFTVPEFARALIVGEFVTTRRVKGKLQVETSEIKIWNPFLDEYQLRQGGKNVAECTKTATKNYDAFKKKKTCAKDGEKEEEKPNKKKTFYMMRIGTYDEGETSTAAGQLSLRIDPPDLNRERKLRTAQRQLHLATKDLIKDGSTFDKEQEEAVVDWINMKELEEAMDLYSLGDDDDEKDKGSEKDGGEGGTGNSGGDTQWREIVKCFKTYVLDWQWNQPDTAALARRR